MSRPAAFALATVLVVLGLAGCNAPGGMTVACHTVTDCQSPSVPVCDAQSLTCRACNPMQASDDTACRNGHPSTPRCGPNGMCVACLTNADCGDKINKPACSHNACGPCTQPSDCQSLVCSADGTCAQVTDVIFVNNMNGSCSGSTHQGTPDDPYCAIQDAVSAAMLAGKAQISVAASTHAYDPVSLTRTGASGQAGTVYLTGASTQLGAVVIQGSNNAPALLVSPDAGYQVTAVVRDVELVGPLRGHGVICNNQANLTLVNSRIHDSGLDGINSSNCTLTVDALRIYDNNHGMFITDGKYAITNVMVWLNRSTGIAFGGKSTGTLSFATIYGNGNVSNASPAGIDCGATPYEIDYSIVYNNIAMTANGTVTTDLQLNGCMLNQVVSNDTKAIGATVKSTIDFVNALGSGSADTVDLHLRGDSAADKDCCIDKVSQSGIVNHDIDFHPRPSPAGGAADIGAHEVQQ